MKKKMNEMNIKILAGNEKKKLGENKKMTG